MLINNITIGQNFKPYVIAEMSNNHLASLDRACRLIEIASSIGADAVKIQTYTPDSLTIDCEKDDFIIKSGPWAGQNYYQLYSKIALSPEHTEKLFNVARDCGITIFSSPFDENSVSLLESLNCPAYKIASFEIADESLIKAIGKTMKPTFISTGIASFSDIDNAVNILRKHNVNQIGLFHCLSQYPASTKDMNLNSLSALRNYSSIYGLSDHSLDSLAAIVSVALGATIFEKHFTLSRSDGGPDAAFSLEPAEFKKYINDINIAAEALGCSNIFAREQRPGIEYGRSIFAVADIKKGEPFTLDNLRVIRPGHGLAPRHFDSILGKVSNFDIERGTPLSERHFDGNRPLKPKV